MTRKKIQVAKVTMFIVGKTATDDQKVNKWLEISGKTAEELRLDGVNAIGFYPTKIIAYYNFSYRDASVDKSEVLYSGKANS
jgi:hypothetical protein